MENGPSELRRVEPRNKDPESLSVVVPCFNESELIEELRKRLDTVCQELKIPYEIVMVDDGSQDATWDFMCRFQREDPHYKIIQLSRNFGHQLALTCGLDSAKGELTLIIDADLQDPPELLHEMITKWREGYDVVYGKRIVRRRETASKRFFAYAFYRVLASITKTQIPLDTGDFRLMDRRALDALLTMREPHRFIRGMVAWVGYHQVAVSYERAERYAGDRKYTFRKSLLLALDAIMSFSYVPLRVASYLGGAVSLFAFFYIFVVIGLKIAGINFRGYTSLMGAILMLGGMQLMVLGIIGEYVGRIFEQGQRRPLYLIGNVRGDPLRHHSSANHQ